MTSINTTLTTSGNSKAVRLPKELLKMSKLGNKVKLEAKNGKIIISASTNPREDWAKQIKAAKDTGQVIDDDFKDMDTAASDGLDEIPWNGPSYEEWLVKHGKLS